MITAQEYLDQIYTKDGDTINCCISFVNDQYVFYYYPKRDIRRPDKLNTSEIKGYSWTKECLPNFNENVPSTVREKEKKKWGYGVKMVQQFNMPVYHSILALNVRKGNHNLYFGPHYTHISKQKIKADTDVSYDQNTYGLNMGYMIVLKTRNEIFDVFLQLDVSLYQEEYWYYTGLYSELESDTKLTAENCISVGVKYNISDKFEIFGGYGIGATDGFIFMFEEIVPHLYFGLQYNFK